VDGLVRLVRRLFGRGLGVPLESHAASVEETAEELGHQLRAWLRGEAVDARAVGDSEHAADRVKHELRARVNALRWSAVPRASLLELIWHQDEIADLCQDAALLMELLRPELPVEVADGFRALGESLVRAVHEYHLVVREFEAGLKEGMPPARREAVDEGVERINLLEHESDLVERALVRDIYRARGLGDFERYHLVQLVLMLGGVVDQVENAAGDLRLIVART
jgi:predicted phosphate transport protein (TIGR00153 family)